jgi:uncharacterized protein (TIGR02646 family)
MRKIIKNQEPDFFSEAKKMINNHEQQLSTAWNNAHINRIRHELRKSILRNEQDSLCAYCETKIDSKKENSNIDHYIKREHNPKLTLIYCNLLVSCNTSDRCSTFKDKNIKSKDSYVKIINPVVENPEDFFDYLPTGEIFPKVSKDSSNKDKAQFTIEAFQLNQKSLVERRKGYCQSIKRALKFASEDSIMGNFPSYKSFQKAIFGRLKKRTSNEV